MSTKKPTSKEVGQWVSTKAKNYKPRGFEGFSVYEILKGIFANFKELRFFERAAAISFNFMLAIPPTLIFLLSLVPFLPLENAQATILSSIEILSPDPKLYSTAQDIIIDFMSNKRRELLSLGFLLAMFYSTNGMQGVIRSFDMVHSIYVPRSGWKRRGRAIMLTFTLMLFIIFSITLLFIQTHVLDHYLKEIFGNVSLVKYVSFGLIILLIYLAFCMIYYYAPSLQQRMRFFSVGALIASLSFIFFSFAFFFVMSYFMNYNKVYGPLGTLLMFMNWIYISALTILGGFEINAAIILQTIARDKKCESCLPSHDGN